MKRVLPKDWSCHPESEKFLLNSLDYLNQQIPLLSELTTIFLNRTSTRLIDWIDHLVFSGDDELMDQLVKLGYEKEDDTANTARHIYRHYYSTFPPIIAEYSEVASQPQLRSVAISVENISEFTKALALSGEIAGTPFSPLRMADIHEAGSFSLKAVERRADTSFVSREMPRDFISLSVHLYERWFNRQRAFEKLDQGLKYTLDLAASLVSEADQDLAAWLAFAAERKYWQLRNRAGRVQKMRQDALGLGWANHDHHTFRSSREAFPSLLEILKTFGFQYREKFYAGSEAGWGAQVLEQPACRLVVFADVDLKPEELELDFEKVELKSFPKPGTVGLWCALHGESILEAGLHHLAARFSFKDLQRDLERERILMLPPFSEFDYLKQAFTQGERWKILSARLENLEKLRVLDSQQHHAYRDEGVIGSHMENIQRDQGFKGFNQESVSDIIRRTDPRLDFGAA